MMNKPKVSIILQTYNERKNIGLLIKRIKNALWKIPFEIIVVDDNSPDKTWELVEKMNRDDKRIICVRRMNKKGLGSAIADGIKLAKGKTIVRMDANLTHSPEIIPRLLQKSEEYGIVLASRYVKGSQDRRTFFRKIISKILNTATYWTLGGIRDYTSGFFVAKRNVFKKVKINEKSRHGEYFIEFLYKAKKIGIKIIEIPFTDKLRGESKSKSKISDLFSYVWLILKLKFG